jgi:hypothetical protein
MKAIIRYQSEKIMGSPAQINFVATPWLLASGALTWERRLQGSRLQERKPGVVQAAFLP